MLECGVRVAKLLSKDSIKVHEICEEKSNNAVGQTLIRLRKSEYHLLHAWFNALLCSSEQRVGWLWGFVFRGCLSSTLSSSRTNLGVNILTTRIQFSLISCFISAVVTDLTGQLEGERNLHRQVIFELKFYFVQKCSQTFILKWGGLYCVCVCGGLMRQPTQVLNFGTLCSPDPKYRINKL